MPSRIAGQVLDANRRPVGNVTISLKGEVLAESRPDGFFSVELARAEARVALTFCAEGYVANTRVYNGKAAGGINTVVIWPIAYRMRFDPARDLDVELGGSRIQIPANGLTGPGGTKTVGPVALRFTLFDITSAFQRAAAPGDFSGRLLNRHIVRLNSYGIFSGGLSDREDRPLGLRPGASISLAIAVPPQLVRNAPKQVGYFDFDIMDGLWNQVGDFDFVPNTLTYNGSVTRFNKPHNLDTPQDTVCVTLHVQNTMGTAMPNATVVAHGGSAYTSTGTTDANGDVCLLVQRNDSFWAEAYGSDYTSAPFPQQNFTSPNFSSGASDCGTALCPLLGSITVDYIVGLTVGIGLPAAR
jgi:hypothetical protein